MYPQEDGTVLTDLKLDFLNAIGNSSDIHHKSDIDFYKLKIYFKKELGMIVSKRGKDLEFKTHELFQKTVVVEFSKKKGKMKGNQIEVKFPGSFFIGDQRERVNEAKRITFKIFEDLNIKEHPHTSMFDICIDRLGASFDSHGVRLNSKDYEIQHRKSKKFTYDPHPYYNDPKDHSRQTGQWIWANKFLWRTYERFLALRQKYNLPQYEEYRNYYNELYEGYEHVLREEIKFKKELCNLFNILFWGHNMYIDQILPKCLSLFSKNHKIIDTRTGKPVQRIEDIFNREEVKSLKHYAGMIGVDSPKRFIYGQKKYNDKTIHSQMSKHYLQQEDVCEEDILKISLKIRKNLIRDINDLIEDIKDRMKTELIMTPPKQRQKIKEQYQQEINRLENSKKKFGDDLKTIKERFKKLIDDMSEQDFFSH